MGKPFLKGVSAIGADPFKLFVSVFQKLNLLEYSRN